MTITTAARRIARRLNAIRGSHSGGFCVFGSDGSGGAFYTGNSFPNPDGVLRKDSPVI